MIGYIATMTVLRVLFALYVAEKTVNANHLSCVCSLAECENVSELDCPNGAGTVWDSCRCCRICARVENEPCGGPYGFSGSCAEGLECVITDFFNANKVGVCTTGSSYGLQGFAFGSVVLRISIEKFILSRPYGRDKRVICIVERTDTLEAMSNERESRIPMDDLCAPSEMKKCDKIKSQSISPVPIVNEFSDQSHHSKKPKRQKCGRRLRRRYDSLDVRNFGLGPMDGLFSENASYALHRSANNMHLVNVSLKNQIVSLKNQLNRLSYDNQRVNRENKMLMLENERLLTTMQNSSLLIQSTVKSVLPHVREIDVKRKTSCGSKEESDLERSTRCTIKEFDNLLHTLQHKEETRKLRDLDLYLDDDRSTRKSRLKSVSQYDVIVKWLNEDENSYDENSKDSSEDDTEVSSKDSSKQSSCDEVSQILRKELLKDTLKKTVSPRLNDILCSPVEEIRPSLASPVIPTDGSVLRTSSEKVICLATPVESALSRTPIDRKSAQQTPVVIESSSRTPIDEECTPKTSEIGSLSRTPIDQNDAQQVLEGGSSRTPCEKSAQQSVHSESSRTPNDQNPAQQILDSGLSRTPIDQKSAEQSLKSGSSRTPTDQDSAQQLDCELSRTPIDQKSSEQSMQSESSRTPIDDESTRQTSTEEFRVFNDGDAPIRTSSVEKDSPNTNDQSIQTTVISTSIDCSENVPSKETDEESSGSSDCSKSTETSGISDIDANCENPKLISGCNIVDSTCRCEHSKTCSDESPFNFKTRQECLINLNAMLAQKDEDERDDSADDEDDDVENCNTPECGGCPSDSVLDGDKCKCDMEKCPKTAFTCSPGLVRQLIQKGTGPGNCCDVYECVEKDEKNCTNVQCPRIPACPADSYQLPSHKSLGDCCSTPQGCQCLPNCDVPNCGPELALVVIEQGTGKPGKCCPVYECTKAVLKNGDEIVDSEPHGCRTDVGKIVENGVTWTTNDPCTTCTCQNGQSVCRSYLCQACLNPVFVADECCPTCLDIHPQPVHCPPLPNCTEPCLRGNMLDTNGCVTCDCQLKDCHLECPNGYAEDSSGHKLCKCVSPPVTCLPLKDCNITCSRGLQKDENGCELCKCHKCPILDECLKDCSYGFEKDYRGCSICKCKPWKIPYGGTPADTNDTSCKTENDVWRDDGENWFDGCRQCTCLSGKEMCSLIHCPTLPCAEPIVNLSSSCCPYCPNDPFADVEMNHMVCTSPSGSLMNEGESWMLNDCTQCVCHNGRALCRSKECPPTPCSHPRPPPKGECCGICSVSNEIETEPFGDDIKCLSKSTNNTAWREGSCTSCKCIDGKVRCYTELCDNNVKCKRSLTVKGKCCPICMDKLDKLKTENVCVVGNLTFKTNEEWTIDHCTRCKCIAGRMDCQTIPCLESCTNGMMKSSRCCPCPNANDGAEFSFMQEISYIALLLIMTCISIVLVVYITRQWRYKKQQIRMRDFGCPPPQYQYKYIPTCPYDTSNSQQITTSEKASLAPV